MSSFQGVGIERFHYTEVSSFQGVGISTIYRGVLISGGWNRERCSTVYRGVLISGGCNRGVPLYAEVSSFQGVGIEVFHCIQRCPHFRGL